MVLELGGGKYLHTAYAVSNIAEELTQEDWSLTSQEGMLYVGTYIDNNSTDSTDPTAYNWEEFLDTNVDDTDAEGILPVADYQSQIDALQDQVDILQTDRDNLQSDIDTNAGNVAGASELAQDAQDIAQAVNQHFWTDDSGAHVTEVAQEEFTNQESPNYQSGANSLWNSLGMLFRRGLNNLLAILAGGTDGTGEKGIAIYDGEGNADSNIVASFTNSGATIGKSTEGCIEISNNEIAMKNSIGAKSVDILHYESTDVVQTTETVVDDFIEENAVTGAAGIDFPVTYTLKGQYLGNLETTVDISAFAGGQQRHYTATQTLANLGAFTIQDGTVDIQGTTAFDSTTNTFTLSLTRWTGTIWPVCKCTITFDTYEQLPTFVIGDKADASQQEDFVLLIGKKNAQGNAVTIDRDGLMVLQDDIYATNHVIGITERGTTSNDWAYRLWSDGTYEAWRSHNFTGITCTSSSAGTYYGNAKTLGVPTFPNNSNTGITNAQAAANSGSQSSGIYIYKLVTNTATSATSDFQIQFRAHASGSNLNCGVDFYIRGTYS